MMLDLLDAGRGAVMWKKLWQFLQDEKNQRMLTLVGGGLAVVVTGLWTAFVYFFPAPPAKPGPPPPPVPVVDKDNLLKNGGFEDDLKFWGTGYYETDVFHGSLGIFWASRVGVGIEGMKIATVRGEIDSDIHKSGSKSFKITNDSPLEANIYGSMSQRITGLLKNTDYIASFWVKAERASRGTFAITIDLKWLKRKVIEAGTYDWKEFSQVFNTGDNTFIDFRIISEEPGTVWVDDIAFRRYFPPK
jgi:Carbohydrate binding domain